MEILRPKRHHVRNKRVVGILNAVRCEMNDISRNLNHMLAGLKFGMVLAPARQMGLINPYIGR